MAQCSAGAGRGHSARAQYLVTSAPSYPGRYGIDATCCLIGRSVVSSRRPADIAGVVGALMGHDARSRRLVEAEATGCCRAGFERDGESMSRPRLYARGLRRDRKLVPHRGPLCKASHEAEVWQAAETSRARPGARRRAGGLGRGWGLTNGLPFGFVFDGV